MYLSKGREVTRLVFLLTAVVCTSPLALGQTLEWKLAQNIEAFDSESPSTVAQLIDFAQRFQIPMGIEWVDTVEEKPARPVHVRKATVQDVLRAILQQQAGYQFTATGGVVQLVAVSLVNDRRNFLNLRIPKFRVEHENLFGAQYRLRVGIQQLLHPSPGFGGGYGGVGLNDDFEIRKITFSGDNLTVREVLSKIAALQGNALWLVRLKPSQMMRNETFYAQSGSLTTKDSASDFSWQFIPLRKVRVNK